MSGAQANGRRRLALRAFPPRWRDRHGNELLYVSGELTSSSDQDAGWRECVDLVRGGLRVRIEDRPPLRVRAAYFWLEKPVPPRWYAWMRDDLSGRFLGIRRNLWLAFPLGLFLGFVLGTDAVGRSQTLVYGSAWFAVSIAFSPLKARGIRKGMNAKVCFDIAAFEVPPAVPLTPPTTIIPPLAPSGPAARLPLVHYAAPLAVWSAISGVALVAGAGISNAPNRSIGPITFSPDPNSPLSAHQVAMIGLGVGLAAVVVVVAVGAMTHRRVRALEPTTAHETRTLRARTAWFVWTTIGVPVTLYGASGAMPDLACAVFGSGLILVGAASGIATLVVASSDADLGRHISLAELLVGERDPATAGPRQPAVITDC